MCLLGADSGETFHFVAGQLVSRVRDFGVRENRVQVIPGPGSNNASLIRVE
jgi:hypothetical protein